MDHRTTEDLGQSQGYLLRPQSACGMNHRRIKVLQKRHEATTGQPGGGILVYLGTDLAESRQEDPTTTHHLDLVPTLDQTFG
jgi:hypothetical protein